MHKILTQYFAQNGHLVMPTIGIIKLHQQEAKWVNATMQPPTVSIVFESIDEKPSKLFYHFLSEQLSVSYEQAIIQYNQFIDEHFNKNPITFELGKFGILSKKEGSYFWNSNYDSNSYFKSIDIHPIEITVEKVEKNRKLTIKWYVWSILLTAIAIAAILFKFL